MRFDTQPCIETQVVLEDWSFHLPLFWWFSCWSAAIYVILSLVWPWNVNFPLHFPWSPNTLDLSHLVTASPSHYHSPSHVAISLPERWHQSYQIDTDCKKNSMRNSSHAFFSKVAHGYEFYDPATVLIPHSTYNSSYAQLHRTRNPLSPRFSCVPVVAPSKSTSTIFAYEGPNQGFQFPASQFRLTLHILMANTVSVCVCSLVFSLA